MNVVLEISYLQCSSSTGPIYEKFFKNITEFDQLGCAYHNFLVRLIPSVVKISWCGSSPDLSFVLDDTLWSHRR